MYKFESSCLQILKRGAHVDDRDGQTDMTLLHYASKAGSVGKDCKTSDASSCVIEMLFWLYLLMFAGYCINVLVTLLKTIFLIR